MSDRRVNARRVSFSSFFIFFHSRITVPYDCVFALNCGRMRLPSSTFGSLSKSTFYVLNFHVGNGVRFYVCSFLFPFYHEIISTFFPPLSPSSIFHYFPTACEMCTVKDKGYECEMRFPLVAGLKYRSISSKLLYLSTQVQARMPDTGRIILLYMISGLFFCFFKL